MKYTAYKHATMVPFDNRFDVRKAETTPPKSASSKDENKEKLKDNIDKLDDIQRMLYAHNRYSVLFVFQAIDAGGKDSTIRTVFKGVNPAGCKVFSFKQPSTNELERDFLWRCHKVTPERGCFTIFNRSYYEETLAVRVHPEYLENQRVPHVENLEELWAQRYASINAFEKHLHNSGTVVLKFWLNISKDEQKNRFLSRLERPEKHWKFSEADLKERKLWPKYMEAFEDTLKHTSNPWAPWYAIPADDKPYARRLISDIIIDNLKQLDIHYPKVDKKDLKRFDALKSKLEKE